MFMKNQITLAQWNLFSSLGHICHVKYNYVLLLFDKKKVSSRKEKKANIYHQQPQSTITSNSAVSTWHIFTFSVDYQKLMLVFKKVLPFREAKTRKTQSNLLTESTVLCY